MSKRPVRLPTQVKASHLTIVAAAVRDLAAAGALPAELVDVSLDETTTLESLGLDSMARLELLAELEDRVDTNIPEASLSGLRTLGDLASALAGARIQAKEAA